MASGSQLHAIEAMRIQTTDEHSMQSQAEEDGNVVCRELPAKCLQQVSCPVSPFSCMSALYIIGMPADRMALPVWQMMISKHHERLVVVNSTVSKDQVDVVGKAVCIQCINVHLAYHD